MPTSLIQNTVDLSANYTALTDSNRREYNPDRYEHDNRDDDDDDYYRPTEQAILLAQKSRKKYKKLKPQNYRVSRWQKRRTVRRWT